MSEENKEVLESKVEEEESEEVPVEEEQVLEAEKVEEVEEQFIPPDVVPRVERIYIVPLWKAWVRKRGIRRAKKAVNFLRRFMIRHMKSVDVKISPEVNEYIWRNGIRNPPRRIKVRAVLGNDDVVYVMLAKDEE